MNNAGAIFEKYFEEERNRLKSLRDEEAIRRVSAAFGATYGRVKRDSENTKEQIEHEQIYINGKLAMTQKVIDIPDIPVNMVKKFDNLLDLLNAEEVELAIEFRKELVKLVECAEEPFKGGL